MTGAPAESTEVKPAPALEGGGYLDQSSHPLTSLLCLIPMIIVYEVGTRWYGLDPINHVENRIIAFNWMQQFFDHFGATGRFMPPLAVVGLLLALHLAEGYHTVPRLWILCWMHVEMVMYAVPLLTLGYLFEHSLLTGLGDVECKAMLVQSVGAGIYEEMLFRLIAFAVLSFVVVDVLQVRKSLSWPIIVVVSAAAFSRYHYHGWDTIDWPSFTFRLIAGIYLGVLFRLRGFGITAGSHAAYDVFIVLLRWYNPS